MDDEPAGAQPGDREVTIKVRLGGPYLVTGPVVLIDHEGRPIPTAPAAGRDASIVLCRCGASSTKPFCDSSHRRAGHDDDVTATPTR
jgi:CDGSH-type Zn-finger protein